MAVFRNIPSEGEFPKSVSWSLPIIDTPEIKVYGLAYDVNKEDDNDEKTFQAASPGNCWILKKSAKWPLWSGSKRSRSKGHEKKTIHCSRYRNYVFSRKGIAESQTPESIVILPNPICIIQRGSICSVSRNHGKNGSLKSERMNGRFFSPQPAWG